MPDFLLEKTYQNLVVCGIDEAGRGPLAGPVVAACAILDQKNFPEKINDSKKLSKNLRQKIFAELKEKCFFGIGVVEEQIIDEINILQATKLAMRLAFENLQKKYKIMPEVILVDGNFAPFSQKNLQILPVIKGDQKSLSIAAASILAKETRDEIMNKIHKNFPQFGFNKNAGYPTKFHVEQIKKFGICLHHRKSFEPIKSMLHAGN